MQVKTFSSGQSSSSIVPQEGVGDPNTNLVLSRRNADEYLDTSNGILWYNPTSGVTTGWRSYDATL